MSLFDLTGKVALVTGSSRGIGGPLPCGCRARRPGGGLVPQAGRLRGGGPRDRGRPRPRPGGGDPREHLRQGGVAVPRRGDGAQPRAGGHPGLQRGEQPYYGPLAAITDAQFRKILDNNVLSNHWLIQLCAPGMVARRDGAIVIVSSIGALKGSPVIGAYNVSKAADLQLARNYAVEYGPHNVRVNCLCPGLVRTDFARALWEDPDMLAQTETGTPLRRIGEPDDIAGAAVFLASPAGRFVTGQALVADGGLTIAR